MGAGVIFASFRAALGQVGDARFRRVLVLGVALAFALLVAVYALFLGAILLLTPDMVELPVIGPVEGVHTLLGWVSLGFMLGLSIFLMVPAAAAFAGLFTEDVAAAVEARHYGYLPPAVAPSLGEQIKASINLVGLIVAVNIAGIFLFPILGPASPLLFWAINGFLLGREYFTTVAARRLPMAEVKAMRRRNGGRIFAAGVLMALPLTVPVVNLVIPVLGTATFTHLFHRLRAAGR